MIKNILIGTGFLLFALINPQADADSFTESFTGYSGVDPAQTSANWNIFDQRLEIQRLLTLTAASPMEICPDNTGGFFLLASESQVWEITLVLQHFNSEGLALWKPPGQILDTTRTSFNGAITVTSDGEVYATYVNFDHPELLVTQLFDINGNPSWPNPAQVNTGSMGSYPYLPETARLPDDGVVIAFLDRRNGPLQVFAQRLDSDGTIYWPGDVRVQPSHLDLENSPVIDTDDTGKIFIGWRQDNFDSDFLYTRMEMNGSIANDPGLSVPLDSADTQKMPSMTVINGDGVYFSWLEEACGTYSIEMIRRDFSGTTDYTSDAVLINSAEQILQTNMTAQTNGTFLISYLLNHEMEYYIMSKAVRADGSSLEAAYQVNEVDNLSTTYEFQICSSSQGGGFNVWANWSGNMGSLRLQRIGNLGQTIWPQYRTIPPSTGNYFAFSPTLTKNSGNQRGFSLTWIDEREQAQHCFGCNYSDPIQATMVPKRLDSTEGRVVGCRSIEAEDGTKIAVWVEYTRTSEYLMAGWYDSKWNLLWNAPVVIDSLNTKMMKSKWDITLDENGQCVLTWIDTYGSSTGVYLQRLTREGVTVHSVPIRVDNSTFATIFNNVAAMAIPGGSVIVSWQSDETGDFDIWAQRMTADGFPAWTPQIRITPISPNYINDIKLARVGDFNSVVFSASYTENAIHRVVFDDSGTIVMPRSQISADYPGIFHLAITVQQDALFATWTAFMDSQINLFAQKLVDGIPVWPDKKLSTLSYNLIDSISLLPTGSNTIAILMSAAIGNTLYTLIQEINPNGDLTYSIEQDLFLNEPKYYNLQWGVSSRVNSGEDVQWATLLPETELNGGNIIYWLSNNGGTSWSQAEPGLPVVFPSSGNDLRWGADLYADLYQEHSPYLNQMTVYWNSSSLGLDLFMNQSLYQEGDPFRLSLRTTNSGSPVTVEQYLLLDVYGEYWFWPGWGQNLEFQQNTIPSGYAENMIFNFEWPPDTGSASDIRFWAACLDPGTADLVGPYDMVTFSFR